MDWYYSGNADPNYDEAMRGWPQLFVSHYPINILVRRTSLMRFFRAGKHFLLRPSSTTRPTLNMRPTSNTRPISNNMTSKLPAMQNCLRTIMMQLTLVPICTCNPIRPFITLTKMYSLIDYRCLTLPSLTSTSSIDLLDSALIYSIKIVEEPRRPAFASHQYGYRAHQRT